METKKTTQLLSVMGALIFLFFAAYSGYKNIGLPPVIIVGGSGLAGLVLWYKTYLKHPVDPRFILPLFLLTVAGLQVHMIEEYLSGFGPAMSRLFDISWTERSFLLVFTFIGPVLYTLTALGLYYRVPFAGFIACFIFIGPGVAEFTHFIFPLLQPKILPFDHETISQKVSNGNYVANMINYYIKTTGRYYFPGVYTAILPMIPGIISIIRLIRLSRQQKVLIARI